MASIPEPHSLSSSSSSSVQSPTEFQVAVGSNLYTFEVISTASDGKKTSLSVNNQSQIDRIQEIATAILTAHCSTEEKLQQIDRIDSRGVFFRNSTCINHSEIGLGQAGAKAILQAREGVMGSDGLTDYQRELIDYHNLSLLTDTSDLSDIDFDKRFPMLFSNFPHLAESFKDKSEMSAAFKSLFQQHIDERSLYRVTQGEKKPLHQPPSLTEETTFATIFKSYNERFVGNQTLDKAWGALVEKVHSLVQVSQASYSPTIGLYQGSFKQKVNTCSANAFAFVEAALTNGLGKVITPEELNEVLTTGEDYNIQTGKKIADRLANTAQHLLSEEVASARSIAALEEAEGPQMLAVDNVFDAVGESTSLEKVTQLSHPPNTVSSRESHKESCTTLFAQLQSLTTEKERAGLTITCNHKTYAVIRDGSTYAIYDSHGTSKVHTAYVKTTWDRETAATLLSDLTYVEDTPNNMNIVCFVKKESSE